LQHAVSSSLAQAGMIDIAVSVLFSELKEETLPKGSPALVQGDSGSILNAAGRSPLAIGGVALLVIVFCVVPCVIRGCRARSSRKVKVRCAKSSSVVKPTVAEEAEVEAEVDPVQPMVVVANLEEKEMDAGDVVARSMLAEVVAQRAAGDLAGAMRVCEAAVSRLRRRALLNTSDGVSALRTLGDVGLAKGDDHAIAMAHFLEARDLARRSTSCIDPEVVAGLLTRIGSSLHSSGNAEQALEALAEARRLLHESGSLETAAGAALVQLMGLVRHDSGDYVAALRLYREAYDIRDNKDTLQTLDGIQLLAEIGQVQLALHDVSGAAAAYAQARHLLDHSCITLQAFPLLEDLLLKVATSEEAFQGKVGAMSVYELALDVGQAAVLRALVLANIGEARAEAGGFEASLEAFEEARRLLQEGGDFNSGEVAEQLARLSCRFGAVLESAGRPQAAVAATAEALGIRRRLHTMETREGALLLQGFGSAKYGSGDPTGALVAYSEALQISECLCVLSAGETIQLRQQIGRCRRDLGDKYGALEVLLEARACCEVAGDLDSVAFFRLLVSLGAAQDAVGHSPAALCTYAAASDICERRGLRGTEDGAQLMINVGIAKRSCGDIVGALDAFESARQTLESAERLDSMQHAVLLMNIGVATGAELELCRQAAAVANQVTSVASASGTVAQLARLFGRLGDLERESGDLGEAAAAYVRAIDVRRANGTLLASQEGARLLGSLGVVRAQCGELGEALEALREARRVHEALGTLATREGLSVLINLGTAHSSTEDHSLAPGVYMEARELSERYGRLATKEGTELVASIGTMKAAAQDFEGALAAYGEAYGIYGAMGKLETLECVHLQINIGSARHAQGFGHRALDDYEEALCTLGRLGATESAAGARLFGALGGAKCDLGDLWGARVAFAEAHRLHHLCGTLHTKSAETVLRNMGLLEQKLFAPKACTLIPL